MTGAGRGIGAKKPGRGSIQRRHAVPGQSCSVSNQTLGQSRGKTSLPQSEQPMAPEQTMAPEQSHRISVETQLSRNVDESVNISSANINNEGVSKKKRGRGSYKSMKVDLLTKYGGKIKLKVADDTDRVVRKNARDVSNYIGLTIRKTVSLRDGEWPAIYAKYGDTILLKVKDKFEIDDDSQESVLRSFVESTMQRLFRAWKSRLHEHYDLYEADEDRLSHPPKDINPDDWVYLVQYFGSPEFQAVSIRNKQNRGKQATKHCCGSKSFAEVEEETRDSDGNKATPDIIWEIQHTRKNDKEERVWSDPKSQEVHQKLTVLVAEQQSLDEGDRITGDQILSSVLGDRTSYVRGKGYGKKPPRKNRQQVDIDKRVSSAVDAMRQQMQAEMDKKLVEKLEEERAEMNLKLAERDEKLEAERAEMNKKLEAERESMRAEMDLRFQAKSSETERMIKQQMSIMMASMQQVGSEFTDSDEA